MNYRFVATCLFGLEKFLDEGMVRRLQRQLPKELFDVYLIYLVNLKIEENRFCLGLRKCIRHRANGKTRMSIGMITNIPFAIGRVRTA